jgi:phosphoribosylformylglycinamidine synthase II
VSQPARKDAAPAPLTDDQASRAAVNMGLLPREYEVLREQLGRVPNHAELAVFSGMWSEHCSYKSTRHLLATLPKEGPRVLAGPGSHAGVVDVGEGYAVAFKIESHNHPSAVEPYQGAATGVGGILRDVIAQGARPCAVMDFLCFGERHSAESRRIERGVVAGIAGYGNAIGVPNVGGRTHYHSAYEGNPLVNALAAGLISPGAQRSARAPSPHGVFLLVGAATGRDGILGAAFASEALGSAEENVQRRSHVQVGDPFGGKLLLEAVLAYSAELGLLAVQDLGACGVACAAFEIAACSDAGLELDLDGIPLREPNMSALEIFLSESQERFAFIIRPDCVDVALRHFQSYGLHAAAIGRLTSSGRVRVHHRGALCIDLPAKLVAGGAPPSSWPIAEALPARPPLPPDVNAPHAPPFATLVELLRKRPDPEPLYSHYDQTVGNRTVYGPGQAAAAVMRLPKSARGFALTLTGSGALCAADPYLGAQSALAEAVRRLACVGAELLAITDGLNFASPRDPIEHRRIAEVIRGIGDGLRALEVPVTGGNVSLYNQSPRGPIPPTPMIGALGVVPDVTKSPPATLRRGQRLLLLGTIGDTANASDYMTLRYGEMLGAPSCDLAAEKRLAALLREAIGQGLVSAAIAVARGGLLTTLARACLRSAVGAALTMANDPRLHLQLFAEHPAQALIGAAPHAAAALTALGARHGVSVQLLGDVGGTTLRLEGLGEIAISELATAHQENVAQARAAESLHAA